MDEKIEGAIVRKEPHTSRQAKKRGRKTKDRRDDGEG